MAKFHLERKYNSQEVNNNLLQEVSRGLKLNERTHETLHSCSAFCVLFQLLKISGTLVLKYERYTEVRSELMCSVLQLHLDLNIVSTINVK